MAKIETLVDTFTNLSNWGINFPGSTGVATLGTGTIDFAMTAPGDFIGQLTTIDYEFDDSWSTVEVTNLSGVTGADGTSHVVIFGAVDDGASDLRYILVQYGFATGGAPVMIFSDSNSGTSGSVTPQNSVLLGLRTDTSGTGLVGYFYSLDNGTTWIQTSSAAWVNPASATSNPGLLAVQSGGADPYTFSLDNFNVHGPPPLPFVPAPTIHVTAPGIMALVGLAVDAVTLSAPPLDTFKSTFDDLTAFTTDDGFGSTVLTADGVLHISYTSGYCFGAVETPLKYRFEDSWTSVRILNLGSSPSATGSTVNLMVRDTGATGYYFGLQYNYNTVTHLVSPVIVINDVSGPSASALPTFTLTSGTLTIGMRVTDGIVYTSYSLDDGATWTIQGSAPWAGLPPATDLNGIVSYDIDTPVSSGELQIDDYNIFEPWPLLPIVETVDGPGEMALVGLPVTSVDLGANFSIGTTPGLIQIRGLPVIRTFLSAGPIVVSALPAVMNMFMPDYNPIVGTYLPGNPVAGPIRIREAGAASYDMTGMDLETDEPATSYTRSLWLQYEADGPMTVSFSATSADPFQMELFNGDSFANFEVAASGASFSHPINTGYTYVRLTSSTSTAILVTWDYVVTTVSLLMDVLTPGLDFTPSSVKVAVQGGLPNENIKFYWSPPVSDLLPNPPTRPITLATVKADPEGNIQVATLPIPAVHAGTYTILAKGLTSGYLANGNFQVTFEPLPSDIVVTPAEPVPAMTTKWLWDEGTGHTWVMPKNPDHMSTVIRPKVLLNETTTSGAGQQIVWKGATPAVDWSFAGTITTQAEYDELVFFSKLNRKFYVTTHRNKVYVVTIRQLDIRPKRNGGNFQTWDYTVTAFLYSEVAAVSS